MPMRPPDHWHCDLPNTPTLPPAIWLNGRADVVRVLLRANATLVDPTQLVCDSRITTFRYQSGKQVINERTSYFFVRVCFSCRCS